VKVAVGMSGGVDSSLTAALLKLQGHTVVGLTMAVFSGDHRPRAGALHSCFGPSEPEEIAAAQEVARFLGIEHVTLDLKREYRESVLDYFKSEYLKGRTPNPCARCNPKVKFGYMLQKAREQNLGFDRFATGHYARLERDERTGHYLLKRGVDTKKDQSYFLYGLSRTLLPSLTLPLGDMTKMEVRQRAQALGLPVAERAESQDFIEGGYECLFEGESIDRGPIVDSAGQTLGEHQGIVHYTIGQRRGLGIAYREPLYVVRIDAAQNTVVVGPKTELFSRALVARDINLLVSEAPSGPTPIRAQIRHNHRAQPATLTLREGGTAQVVFETALPAITPGQAVVFYDGDTVLGGGIIDRALREPGDETSDT
jgi:tRNA-uridine 2-sulfurtransferase